jgi:ABC-type multidrug transport system permease subunit
MSLVGFFGKNINESRSLILFTTDPHREGSLKADSQTHRTSSRLSQSPRSCWMFYMISEPPTLSQRGKSCIAGPILWVLGEYCRFQRMFGKVICFQRLSNTYSRSGSTCALQCVDQPFQSFFVVSATYRLSTCYAFSTRTVFRRLLSSCTSDFCRFHAYFFPGRPMMTPKEALDCIAKRRAELGLMERESPAGTSK